MTKRYMGFIKITVVALAVGWAATANATLSPADKCEKAKNKAVAKSVQCVSTQRGKEIGGKIPDFASCVSNFTDAFTKAETRAGGACPMTGDAAAVSARLIAVGNPSNGLVKWLSNTRFVDNGDGTVSDTLTGLMWKQKDNLDSVVNLSDPHDADNLYSWSSTGTDPDGTAFTDFLAELNNCESTDGTIITGGFADHCDWPLPTSAELQTIVKLSASGCGSGSPCIDETIFGPTQASGYWSSTTYATLTDFAGRVEFEFGGVGFHVKSDGLSVRAVRGGL